MKNGLTRVSVLAFGYGFLYVPIVLLIAYSFNESRLVTVWSGFSTKWYGELADNHALLDATWRSLRIGAINATLATALGMCAGIALGRWRRFRGRALLEGLISAPLVMPDVILGVSSLLLFVSLLEWVGWPANRGTTTITLAHITFSLAYVTVIVRAKIVNLDPALEEAAADLGASPSVILWRITVPLLAPALIAGWLLAFTLSLDDLVIASFVSGPGATTLPMVVYSSVRLGVSPQINALATLLIVVVALGAGVAAWLLRKKG